MLMNRRSNVNRKSSTKRQKKYAIVIKNNKIIYVFCVFVFFVIAKRTIENYQLRNGGICTKAIIQNKYTERHKQVRVYKFRVGNKVYSGTSIYDWHLDIGDTLDIVYLPSNPKINRSVKSIE